MEHRRVAAVGRAPGELDEMVGRVGRAVALRDAPVQSRRAADALEVPAHAGEVERRPGDQEYLWSCLTQRVFSALQCGRAVVPEFEHGADPKERSGRSVTYCATSLCSPLTPLRP